MERWQTHWKAWQGNYHKRREHQSTLVTRSLLLQRTWFKLNATRFYSAQQSVYWCPGKCALHQRVCVIVVMSPTVTKNRVIFNLGYCYSDMIISYGELLWNGASLKPGVNRSGQLDQAQLTLWVGGFVANLLAFVASSRVVRWNTQIIYTVTMIMQRELA